MIDIIKVLSHTGLRGLALNIRHITFLESFGQRKSSTRCKASTHTKYRRHFNKFEFNNNDSYVT